MKISEAIKLIEKQTGKSIKLVEQSEYSKLKLKEDEVDSVEDEEVIEESITNEQKASLPDNIKKCIPSVVYNALLSIEKNEESFILTIKKGKSIDYTLFLRLLKARLMFSVFSTSEGLTKIIIPQN